MTGQVIQQRSAAGAIFAGGCATLLGVGLQRFAYAPLLPAMVLAGWLGPGAAGVLGASNLGGYLLGAAAAPAMARRVGMRQALRAAMLAAAACFALCAWPGGLAWFLPWRILAGMAGGLLMVLAGPAVQQAVAANLRGRAAGVMFGGVGVGIVAGAVLIPALLPLGLSGTWLALAVAALALTMLSWRLWPDVPAPPRLPVSAAGAWRLIVCYALAAAGSTPQMVWWPDYITRGLGLGAAEGALMWTAYGVAAAAGAVLCGGLAGRLGIRRLYVTILVLQAAGLALPLLNSSVPSLFASSVLAGASALSTAALTLLLAKEVAGNASAGVWRVATAAFGAAQTACGFGLAALYSATGSHLPLLAVGLALTLVSLPLARR
jgi:predicted MFS family arabinose efflux permease